tara:strand:+ start:52055 stop:55846 length:3792 start_codon:yes stop_codon:yes gene_type:complete
MPSLFKRLAEYTFYLLAIVLVALASLTSAIRYSPEFSNVVAERIEVHLGDLSKMAVDVESLEIGADGLSLYLVARNVNFQSLDKADRSWQIDQISISPAVFKSIIKQRLLLSEIVLQGLDLELLRDQQGQIHVNQFFVIPEQATPQKSSFWSELQLRVLATNIHWQDELLQVDYHFNDVNASVDPVGQGVAIFFSAGLPDELGKRIVLHAEMDEGLTDFRQAGIDFHWEIQDIQLAAVAEKLTDIDGERINTSLNSEAWGRLDGMRLNALRGSVELSQLMTESSLNSYDRCLSEDYINQISMNYVWSRDANDWDVLLDDIKIQTEQEAWPTTSARLSLVEHNSTARTVKAFISYLDIGALCNTVNSYAEYIDILGQNLQPFKFNADIEDLSLQFNLSDEHQADFDYSAKVTDAEFVLANGQNLSGLSGTIIGAEKGGKFVFDSKELSLRLPQLYPDKLLSFATEGEMYWHQETGLLRIHSEYLKLKNSDLDMALRLTADWTRDDIYIDMQTFIGTAKIAVIDEYIPDIRRLSKTKTWFSEAFEKGEVDSAKGILRGSLRDFPYHKEAGAFELSLNVKQALIEYMPEWPMLSNVSGSVAIEKDHIIAYSDHAMIYDSIIKDVTIEIDSFLQGVLRVNATADGSGDNLIRYIDEAKLMSTDQPLSEVLALQGDTRLEFEFSHSISEKRHQPFEVSGDLFLLQNRLSILSFDIDLDDLVGSLSFSEEGIVGENISADLLDNPIKIQAATGINGTSNIFISGTLDIARYLKQRFIVLKDVVAGQAEVNAVFKLPSLFIADAKEKMIITASSNLKGLALDLPEPLKKSATSSMPINLSYDVTTQSLELNLNNLLYLNMGHSEEGLSPQSIVLGGDAGSESSELVSGHWSQVDPIAWYDFYQKNMQLSEASVISLLPEFSLHFNELLLANLPAKDIYLNGRYQGQDYQLDISSDLLVGSIHIPAAENELLSVDLERLHLKKAEQTDDIEIDPRDLPEIQLNVDELKFDELTVNDVAIDILRSERGLLFDPITFKAVKLEAQGRGSWQLDKEKQAHSNFQLSFKSSDIEDSLRSFGTSSALKNSDAVVETIIRWPAAPHQIDLEMATGISHIDLGPGLVKDVEPGAGRFIALFNLAEISRRLTLNFSDVAKSGFTYDRIEGQFELFPGGEVHTDELIITSSAANITIQGDTNIITKTYDQDILVEPTVTNSLPTAGAIIAGPIGIAAGFLAKGIAAFVGLDELANMKYEMRGTWEQPEFTKVPIDTKSAE